MGRKKMAFSTAALRLQMQCEPSAALTRTGAGKLAARVPVLLSMPMAVPAIQKEARLPAAGELSQSV